jgi:hypothetical protein
MPKYLTPDQYKRSSDGMYISDNMPLETLASFIQRAESDIDAYMEFDPNLGGFEPHEAWYQEAWDHTTLKTTIPNRPVPIRDVTRYRIQVSNVSQSGDGFFANINKGDVVFNLFSQYIEIVPLQSITYAMTPVIVALGLNPPLVQVDYLVGFYLAAFKDTLYDSGDGLTFRSLRGFWADTYQMASFARPNKVPPVPPIIYVNGVAQSPSTYSLDSTEGSVTFLSSQAKQRVTADYTYQIPDLIKAATIAQTSWLIGQADLNSMGMSGLEMARDDRQEAKRMKNSQKNNICVGASDALDSYVNIAIG